MYFYFYCLSAVVEKKLGLAIDQDVWMNITNCNCMIPFHTFVLYADKLLGGTPGVVMGHSLNNKNYSSCILCNLIQIYVNNTTIHTIARGMCIYSVVTVTYILKAAKRRWFDIFCLFFLFMNFFHQKAHAHRKKTRL